MKSQVVFEDGILLSRERERGGSMVVISLPLLATLVFRSRTNKYCRGKLKLVSIDERKV